MKGKQGDKGDKGSRPPPPQQAILSRLSFLHQASSLLHPSSIGLSRYYTSHLQSVSRKSVQRLSPAVKHTICKRCSSPLLPGVISTTRIENKSKNGRKPWADVVVVTCGFCGGTKRFPTFDKKMMKRNKHMKNQKDIEDIEEEEGAKEKLEEKDMRVDADMQMTGT
ncbi:hypothetical protein TWF481_006147 [Arthrobotrys musiformis]|uniref:Rpr2-domain-containing protein n=1 Tax=Arthrobotrys musiformis TaxID=47236 RepID=A0AAV9WGE9_9PEZI